MSGRMPWRTGRKIGRTVYDADDELIGVMDTRDFARWVVLAVNEAYTQVPGDPSQTSTSVDAVPADRRAEVSAQSAAADAGRAADAPGPYPSSALLAVLARESQP